MEVNQQRLVDEFLELVKIDSQPKDERLIADALISKMQDLGFAVTEDDSGAKIGGSAGNLIGILEGQKDAPALLFCAHMDRVHPGWALNPRSGRRHHQQQHHHPGYRRWGSIAAILEAVRLSGNKIPHGRGVSLLSPRKGLFRAKSVDRRFGPKQGFHGSGGPVGTIVTAARPRSGSHYPRQGGMQGCP